MKCMGEYCSYWVDDKNNPSIALCMRTNELINLDEVTPEENIECDYMNKLSEVCENELL